MRSRPVGVCRPFAVAAPSYIFVHPVRPREAAQDDREGERRVDAPRPYHRPTDPTYGPRKRNPKKKPPKKKENKKNKMTIKHSPTA
jgi:hypothetical protein